MSLLEEERRQPQIWLCSNSKRPFCVETNDNDLKNLNEMKNQHILEVLPNKSHFTDTNCVPHKLLSGPLVIPVLVCVCWGRGEGSSHT